MNSPIIISQQDLALAYRKAKVDLFYSPRSCRTEILEFEENLTYHLTELRSKIESGRLELNFTEEHWTLVPADCDYKPGSQHRGFINSDPAKEWEVRKKTDKPHAEFRVMERLPISFHVLASHWILTIGEKFEAKLLPSARGNRLRRKADGSINKLSLGSCLHYFAPYRKWRNDGVQAIESALTEEKEVIAITADVSAFYHKLSPDFLLDPEFHKLIGIELTNNEHSLNRLFIHALNSWSTSTPLGRGLPVGLAASAVIANLSLWELDKVIHEEITPRYYGRYVDDIILVLENIKDFSSSEEVWNWLLSRSNGSIKKKGRKGHATFSFNRSYLKNCTIDFNNEKNKSFSLSGPAGKSLLSTICSQMAKRTSEWRAMPDLPDEESKIEAKVLEISQADGLPADSLRKADTISIRRSGFAIQLRDLEAYSRLLNPKDWTKQRHAFYNAFIRHVLVLPHFFGFYNYLSRVIALATFCKDFQSLRNILDALKSALKELDFCSVSIKSHSTGLSKDNIILKFKQNLQKQIQESIDTSIPFQLSAEQEGRFNKLFSGEQLFNFSSIKQAQDLRVRYLKRDLAYRPLKSLLMPSALSGYPKHANVRQFIFEDCAQIYEHMPTAISEGHNEMISIIDHPRGKKILPGLFFPTRPPSIADLYYIDTPFSHEGRLRLSKILLACRGYFPQQDLPWITNDNWEVNQPKNDRRIVFPHLDSDRKDSVIAVSSWKTDLESWVAAATGNVDRDRSRLRRLSQIVNDVIRRGKSNIDYIIFPELSIPPCWFYYISSKLSAINVSLIAGVEYLHQNLSGNRVATVSNQVWCNLVYKSLGYTMSAVYRQDKQHAAIHEERQLFAVAGTNLLPEKVWTVQPPIISHQGIEFALLICSELTNITYRNSLRGKIDVLFVLEWNQDTDSFNALVESAALDIHAFIVQCNDRAYGDSRIRAPFKEAYERDVVRVKGGIDDFFVVARIDYESLRKFQSAHRSPERPFKPVPDGFAIAPYRKTLPLL